jgi:hypothetical protein
VIVSSPEELERSFSFRFGVTLPWYLEERLCRSPSSQGNGSKNPEKQILMFMTSFHLETATLRKLKLPSAANKLSLPSQLNMKIMNKVGWTPVALMFFFSP